MGVKETAAGMPAWLKWAGVLVVAVVLFKVIVGVLSALVSMLFTVLLFAAVVALVVFLARKFLSSSSGPSSGGW